MIKFTDFIIDEISYLTNINDLLNTTKRFKEYKEKYYIWYLNNGESIEYYKEKYIKKRLIKINEQRLQLSFSIHQPDFEAL